MGQWLQRALRALETALAWIPRFARSYPRLALLLLAGLAVWAAPDLLRQILEQVLGFAIATISQALGIAVGAARDTARAHESHLRGILAILIWLVILYLLFRGLWRGLFGSRRRRNR